MNNTYDRQHAAEAAALLCLHHRYGITQADPAYVARIANACEAFGVGF